MWRRSALTSPPNRRVVWEACIHGGHPPTPDIKRLRRLLCHLWTCLTHVQPSPRALSALPEMTPLINTICRVLVALAIGAAVATSMAEPGSTLECHKRYYQYTARQADSGGRVCWDNVTVLSCWGRCDSNEISDWRFPYKRSYHPVCLHGLREPRTVVLSHCEEGAEPGTELFTTLHAVSCRCSVCRSSEASCQGLRYRPQH